MSNNQTAMLSEADIENQLSGIFTDVAKRINTLPMSPKERQDFYGRFLVGVSNAAGVSMDGKTFYDPAAASPRGVEDIAQALGTEATRHRNTVSVYPFVRPSLGASGTILYTDAKTGELNMLLVRRKKDSGQWTYPAGYIELMPEGDKILPDRISAQAKDMLEEKTVGAFKGEQVAVAAAPQGVALPAQALPDGAAIMKVLDTEYRTLMTQKGWEEAHDKMRDGGYIRETLKKNGLALPVDSPIDMTAKENYLRELREETGLNPSLYPQARTDFVRSHMSLSYSSGGQRKYTAAPHFVTDLGALDTPPPIAPQAADTVEAAWVPVKNIQREADGNYAIRSTDGKPSLLNLYTVPVIEESLHKWLSTKISDASGQRLGSPLNVQADMQSWTGKERLRGADEQGIASLSRIGAEPLSDNGMLPDLTGPEGATRIADYLKVAELLSSPPSQKIAPAITASGPVTIKVELQPGLR